MSGGLDQTDISCASIPADVPCVSSRNYEIELCSNSMTLYRFVKFKIGYCGINHCLRIRDGGWEIISFGSSTYTAEKLV